MRVYTSQDMNIFIHYSVWDANLYFIIFFSYFKANIYGSECSISVNESSRVTE